MDEENPRMLERFLTYNRMRVEHLRKSQKTRWLFTVSPRLRKLAVVCDKEETPKKENAALAAIVNAFEEGLIWRTIKWSSCAIEDLSLFCRQFGKRKTIDRSDRRKKDYYSVAVIVKNEARYIKEFILFYLATGADRIYRVCEKISVNRISCDRIYA